MAINNVADLFVATLEQAGVKRIYGIVGDSLNGLTEALRRRGTIEWVHVRHEEVAAFAAAGEAEMTGCLAVCAGSCGPGNLHLITACSTRIAAACRCWRSRRRFPRPRSAAAISRRPIRRISSANAAIIAS